MEKYETKSNQNKNQIPLPISVFCFNQHYFSTSSFSIRSIKLGIRSTALLHILGSFYWKNPQPTVRGGFWHQQIKDE